MQNRSLIAAALVALGLGWSAPAVAEAPPPGFDFMTMDFAELTFALRLSPGLRARPGSIHMSATLTPRDAPPREVAAPLTPAGTSDGAELLRLTPEGQATFERIRDEIREMKQAGRKGALNLQAAAEQVCLERGAASPPRFDILVRTAPEGGFTPLARGVDLDAQRQAEGLGPVPPCD